MDEIRFADGTVIQGGHAIADGERLWVYVNGGRMDALFAILYNPEKTAKITSVSLGVATEHKGYTELFAIRKEDSGIISAGLRKE